MKKLVLASAALMLTVAGCTGTTSPTESAATGSPAPAAAAEQPLLARYGLAGKSAVEVIDRLDRLGLQQRPADLKASVRTSELLLTAGGQEQSLPIPGDRFYLSVAPYVQGTHECFYHSLTTCKGELADAQVQVRIVDDAGKVLVDETRTTFANGFIGFWLPRDITGTLRMTSGGKTAESTFSTAPDAPTCLTTVQLV
ncbi:CueP family metal-binding protein [Actinoplanes sp. NPDC049316]|uniref:CueP family metal-binding protein n=1 Tax=Actinoplanes sp. NPDC049316 TaxID=3154727 RepID=UPI003414C279